MIPVFVNGQEVAGCNHYTKINHLFNSVYEENREIDYYSIALQIVKKNAGVREGERVWIKVDGELKFLMIYC